MEGKRDQRDEGKRDHMEGKRDQTCMPLEPT